MEQRRVDAMQEEYVERMIKNLPLLRTAVDFTQAQLGKKLGMSRQTIVAIENRKRPLPWYLYLAMILVFMQEDESLKLLESFDLFDREFIRHIL